MHLLNYCICLRILDTGWLMLKTKSVTKGLEVKFEVTSIVADNTWVIAEPGPVADDLSK